MAAAGVSYAVGREPNAQFGETLNGMQRGDDKPRTHYTQKDKDHFIKDVDPYVKPGDPTSGLLPFVYGMSSWVYLVAALGFSAGFCAYAFKLWRNYSDDLARRTFRFSLIHLSGLFAALLLDHYLL